MANFKPAKIERLNAEPVRDALADFVKANHLTEGLMNQAVFSAWDDASGAAAYTVNRYRKGDTLYITLSSSVCRSQLSFQKDAILQRLNALLSESFAASITGESLHINKLILH